MPGPRGIKGYLESSLTWPRPLYSLFTDWGQDSKRKPVVQNLPSILSNGGVGGGWLGGGVSFPVFLFPFCFSLPLSLPFCLLHSLLPLSLSLLFPSPSSTYFPAP